MQPMTHNPGAAGIGAQVVANGARGLAAGTAATAAVTALVPAGADEVSAQAAVAFAAEGVETLAQNTFAQEELTRAGAAYVEAAGIYEAVDAANAATLA
jgi:PE family